MVYGMMTVGLTGPTSYRQAVTDLLRKEVEYLNKKYPGQRSELLTSYTGRMPRVAWLQKHHSMADVEADAKKRSEDEQWKALAEGLTAIEDKFGLSPWDNVEREFWIVVEE